MKSNDLKNCVVVYIRKKFIVGSKLSLRNIIFLRTNEVKLDLRQKVIKVFVRFSVLDSMSVTVKLTVRILKKFNLKLVFNS